MLIFKFSVVTSLDSFVVFIRSYRSAYRLKPGCMNSDKLDVNKEDEERFNEKVVNAMLHKRKSPLRLFDRRAANLRHLKKRITSPNAPYYGRDDLPTYGSYQNYVKEAERAREKQRKEKLEWRTMDHWWRERDQQTNFVNIGLSLPPSKPTKDENKAVKVALKKLKTDPALEKAARKRTLKMDVDAYIDEREVSHQGVMDGFKLGMHNHIYAHLFGHAYFYPVVPLNISYDIDGDNVNPIYYGNEIQPSEAASPPDVLYESDPDQMWSLILTNPDGNLEDNNAEYLHWFVANIKGNRISSGQTVVDYMQPLPVRGTGYHRMIFLLFKQDKEIDFSDEERNIPCLSLRERDFKTKNFYRKHKDNLTPVSFRFFQTKWEPSIQEFYQSTLDMAEPVYDFQPTKISRRAPLSLWPYKKSFEWLRSFFPKEPIYPGGGKFT